MMRAAMALAATLLVAACASTSQPSAGSTRDAVQAQWGTPRGLYDLPGGGQRLLYVPQPASNESFNFDFDANGRLVSALQVRTAERFSAAGRDHWRMSEVQRTFGVPTGRDKVEKAETDRWTYHFLDNRLPRLAIVYFDDSNTVQRVEFAPDNERLDDRYLR